MNLPPQLRLGTSRLGVNTGTAYAVRMAQTTAEVEAAQALRFRVFNLELKEGLAESFATGRDADPFDEVCDHLLVENLADGSIIGTYRLQTGAMAREHRGYYSEQEFEFTPFEKIRGELVELGRACVHKSHRNLTVLGLLWKGIADYAEIRRARYLCGCSSLTSQEATAGASAYAVLCRKHLVATLFRTRPHPGFECPLEQLAEQPPPLPKLLRAYLSAGAKICGPPAMDRAFKTIDFLTFMDLATLPALLRARFFG